MPSTTSEWHTQTGTNVQSPRAHNLLILDRDRVGASRIGHPRDWITDFRTQLTLCNSRFVRYAYSVINQVGPAQNL